MRLFGATGKAGKPRALGGYAYARTTRIRGVAPDPILAGEFPRRLYWEQPDGPGDSGWRVFSGTETQADADDPKNFPINAVSTLIAVHPQLAQVLAPGVRGAWEWNDSKVRYVEVSD